MKPRSPSPLRERFATLHLATEELANEWRALDLRLDPRRARSIETALLREIEKAPGSTMIELAQLLEIDKAVASRALALLVRQKTIRALADGADARRRILELTPLGKRQLAALDSRRAAALEAALNDLSSLRVEGIGAEVSKLAKALRKHRLRGEFSVRPIHRRDDRAMAAIIRRVMTEHGASGAGFAIHDAEVDSMSNAYSRAGHCYFVVVRGKRVVGGGGIAPLSGADSTTCELRKMYFLPEARGLGLGADTLSVCLEAAREWGYKTCYLETLESMRAARALYEAFGFTKRCGPLGATGHFACDAWYELDLTRRSASLRSAPNAGGSRTGAKR